MKNKIHLIICIIKSFFLNLYYLPFLQAIRCPILVGLHTKIKCSGKIKISGSVHFRMILIGYTNGSFNMGANAATTNFCVQKKGSVTFGGKCTISAGSVILVNEGGQLKLGENVFINANSLINSGSSITIGDNFIGGWNMSLIDGDGHRIVNLITNEIINDYKPIVIGHHCWVSANATLLKGVTLADNVIIPYGAVITKSCFATNTLFGGFPNKVLKSNIIRHG